MPVRTTFTINGETARRLREMVEADHSKMSSFLAWLINKEYERRHEWSDSIPEYVSKVEPVASP